MLYGDAGDAVEQRRDAALVGDDHRRACGDGLGRGVAEIFVLRGQDEDIGVAVSGPFGVSREGTGKMNSRGHSQLRRHLSKAGEHAGLVRPDEDEMCGG